MKVWQPLIGAVIIIIALTGLSELMEPEIASVLGILFLVCLALIAYSIIRNIFQAIKTRTAKAPMK